MPELYRLDFPNGKSYVGITSKTALKRFTDHASNARRPSFAVHHAIKKYGVSSVVLNTLVIGDWEYLCEAEKRAIVVFNTKAPSGYNLTDGGEGVVGNVMSDEAKRLLSVFNTGKVMPEPTRSKISKTISARMNDPKVRKNISEKLKGKIVSEETKARLSAAAKRRYENPEERKKSSVRATGKVVSVETCEKLSRSLKAYNAQRKQNA